jgi:hypothetical protein
MRGKLPCLSHRVDKGIVYSFHVGRVVCGALDATVSETTAVVAECDTETAGTENRGLPRATSAGSCTFKRGVRIRSHVPSIEAEVWRERAYAASGSHGGVMVRFMGRMPGSR